MAHTHARTNFVFQADEALALSDNSRSDQIRRKEKRIVEMVRQDIEEITKKITM